MEELIKAYSLRDLISKIDKYRAQGGRVLEETIRQTGESTYVFSVDYSDNYKEGE